MRGLKSTLALLVVFLGVLAYIYFVESRRESTGLGEAKPKVFTVDAANVQTVRVTNDKGETSLLEKRDGTWRLVEPVAALADEVEASGLTNNLASLEIQRVVEETPADLGQYGLSKPRVEVGFKAAGDSDFRRLLIGDKTATGSDLYARLPDEKRVILIAGHLETTFNRSTFELRDKSVLKFERDKVDQIEISAGKEALRLTKTGTDWKMVAPWSVRADNGLVEGLLGQVSSAQMKVITAENVEKPQEYGLAQPQATATVGAGSARATLTIGNKVDDMTMYARDASRTLVFTVESSLLDELRKPAVDYRRKDVFDFRSFEATRFEIVRAGQTLAFEKVKGTGENAQETWRQTAPSAADVDTTKMDDVLSKFSMLRAESFADSRANTGLDTPEATVVVRSGEAKTGERVVFGRSGGTVFAGREDEAGAARLTGTSFDEALKAVDEVVKK